MAPGLGAQYSKAPRFQGQQDPRSPHSEDNQIFERPARNLRERGGYGGTVFERSACTKAAMHPVLAGAVATGAGLALAAAFWPRVQNAFSRE